MSDSGFLVAILWSAIGFGAYYFLAASQDMNIRLLHAFRGLQDSVKAILMQRAWGVIFLGIASIFLLRWIMKGIPSEYGLDLSFLQSPPWWSWLAIPLILGTGLLQARSADNLEMYPQIREKQWTPGMVVMSALSWIAFLVAYEFFFRGFLLYASLQVMGEWQAIALNCALYSFAHFYKGPGESFGAIPVGFILCYLTLLTGNIWMAVLIHCVMALSNEWFSLYFHPEMHLVKSKS